MVKKRSNGLGITSLILGIGSIVFSWVPFFGLISGILGLIFAIKQKKVWANGIAQAGLITSIIGVVFSAVQSLIILALIFTGMMGSI